jgi:Mrp family chromosome partitioning ATPase
VDTPPILAVADPVIVSEHADGVLMVVHAGQTPAPSVAAGIEKLKAAKARVLGAILNALDFAEQDYYSYRYGYRYGYYSHGDAEPERAAASDTAHRPSPPSPQDAGAAPGGGARSGSART